MKKNPKPPKQYYWWSSFGYENQVRGVIVTKAAAQWQAIGKCAPMIDPEWDAVVVKMDPTHRPAKKYLDRLLTEAETRDMMAPYGEVVQAE